MCPSEDDNDLYGFYSIDSHMLRTRAILFRRLQDAIGMPQSRISRQERDMAADLLVEMLTEADTTTRVRCSERISQLPYAPSILLRFLSCDIIEVARPILQVSQAFNDSDLIYCANSATSTQAHRLFIAQRKVVNEVVTDALTEFGEIEVCRTLLLNKNAKFANDAFDKLIELSKQHNELVPLLLDRDELLPAHGFTVFWWSDSKCRNDILNRFAVERAALINAGHDLYPRAAADNWQDAVVRKSLQFIERRQRNRLAIDKSPFDNLEGAIDSLEKEFSRETIKEISYLAGIKPSCGAKIFSDKGGEAIAIFCKATGLKPRFFTKLWCGLHRPVGTAQSPDKIYAEAFNIYESLSTNCAQTVLRYWNWLLTSAMSPANAAIENSSNDSPYSIAAKYSRIVFKK